MRALILFVVVAAGPFALAESAEVMPKDQMVVEVQPIDRTINGIRMVKMTGIEARAIMWDEDGTTYLVTRNYTGEEMVMRISHKGAAAQIQMWYKLWPLLADRRGDVWVIDDSKRADYLSKLQHYWTSWRGGLRATQLFAGGGAAFAVIGAIDAATLHLFFDPATGFVQRFVAGGFVTWGMQALADAVQSHRQLGRNYNFFTKRLLTNVERLDYVRQPSTNALDIEIRYKEGKSKGQPRFMSEVFAEKKVEYRKADCLQYLDK